MSEAPGRETEIAGAEDTLGRSSRACPHSVRSMGFVASQEVIWLAGQTLTIRHDYGPHLLHARRPPRHPQRRGARRLIVGPRAMN
ncbi:MAG: hypothetical protein ACLUE1_06815 [Adlercreutzia equolifaciens]